MAELKFIPLTLIDMIGNYREVEPISPSDPDIIELAKNIKKVGVLQAILVRPHPVRADRYELIFGHRRHVASGVAGLNEIPASVREVADEDILEIQVTENLQRKDVHPLDEAIAFLSLKKEKGYEIEDIAAKFDKSIEFVTHRMKLNDLVIDFQKPFKKNLISVGQAFVIARLRKEDQLFLRKNWRDDEFKTSSVSDVQSWINDRVLRRLSSAAFKKDDATLDPKAGACKGCLKHSGSENLLFKDLDGNDTKDDRCFDGTCFDRKLEIHFTRELQNTIETKPNVHLVASDPGKLSKDIKDLLRQMNVKLLESNKYESYGYGKKKQAAKAFHLDGSNKGKIETIYVDGPAAKKASGGKEETVKRTVEDITREIDGIKERQVRFKQLDTEKVHKATLVQLQARKDIRKPGLAWQVGVDRGIMIFLLLHKAANYSAKDEIRKNIKSIPKDPPYNPHAFQPAYFEKLAAITDDELATIIRIICLEEWGNPQTVSGIDEDDTTLRMIAQYAGIDIGAIEKAQDEEAQKRIARADKRLQALKEEKKVLEDKKKPKAKAAAKKSASAKDKAKLQKGIQSLLNQPANEGDNDIDVDDIDEE